MTELGITQIDRTVQAAQAQAKIAALQEKSAALGKEDMAKIDAAAQEFEAVFLTEMLRPMFEEINQPDELFGGGKGEEIFSGMMVEEYGKQMAAKGGIGLAASVKAEMIRIQEAANGK